MGQQNSAKDYLCKCSFAKVIIGGFYMIDDQLLEQLRKETADNWTIDPETNRSNSSPLFIDLERIIEQIIRGSAYHLISGRADMVAGLIMAQLAHKYGLRPSGKTQQAVNDELRPALPTEDAK